MQCESAVQAFTSTVDDMLVTGTDGTGNTRQLPKPYLTYYEVGVGGDSATSSLFQVHLASTAGGNYLGVSRS